MNDTTTSSSTSTNNTNSTSGISGGSRSSRSSSSHGKRSLLRSHHAAAAALSLAILAGSILASALPVAAAQPSLAQSRPVYGYTAPTPTPCITICAGQINHR